MINPWGRFEALMAFTHEPGVPGGKLDGGAPREFYVLYHSFTVLDAIDENATQVNKCGVEGRRHTKRLSEKESGPYSYPYRRTGRTGSRAKF